MILKVKAKTGSKKQAIIKTELNCWEIWTTKRPIDNQANLDIIKIVAKELSVATSKVSIIRGKKSKQKELLVDYSEI